MSEIIKVLKRDIEYFEKQKVDLEKLIYDRRKRLAKLEEEANEVDYPAGFWKPEAEGDGYIFMSGANVHWLPSTGDADLKALAHGGVYKDKSDYEKALPQREAYSKLVRVIAKVNSRNGKWKPDWSDFQQRKQRLSYRHDHKEIAIVNATFSQANHDREYFAPESFREVVSRAGEETIKLALGIEDD
jgi:hypothetical protein